MNSIYHKYPGSTYADYYHRQIERYCEQGYELADIEAHKVTDENQMPKILERLNSIKKMGQQELKKAV